MHKAWPSGMSDVHFFKDPSTSVSQCHGTVFFNSDIAINKNVLNVAINFFHLYTVCIEYTLKYSLQVQCF